MAQTINLLPVELARGKEVNLLLARLKIASIITCSILLLTSMAGLAYVVVEKKNVDNLITTRDTLKSEVINLESSEKQLVLLKDRLQKILSYRALDTSRPQIENQKKVIDVLPADVSIVGSKLDAADAKIGLSSATLAPLREVTDRLVSEKLVSQLAVSNITYNQSTGYQVYFDFNK
jgi:hypothetical protein